MSIISIEIGRRGKPGKQSQRTHRICQALPTTRLCLAHRSLPLSRTSCRRHELIGRRIPLRLWGWTSSRHSRGLEGLPPAAAPSAGHAKAASRNTSAVFQGAQVGVRILGCVRRTVEQMLSNSAGGAAID